MMKYSSTNTIFLRTEIPLHLNYTWPSRQSVNLLLCNKNKMLLSKLVRAIDHPYLKGKGGRMMNNARKGMQVKKNDFNPARSDKSSIKPVLPNENANQLQMEMQGIDMDSLRHHVGIQPLFVIFGGAMTLISAFVSLVNFMGNGRRRERSWWWQSLLCSGGEEVSLWQWHQLGQDQGLGGMIKQDEKRRMSKNISRTEGSTASSRSWSTRTGRSTPTPGRGPTTGTSAGAKKTSNMYENNIPWLITVFQ